MSDPERLPVVENANGEPINLTQVLKLANWVMSGGEAKTLIAEGHVRVNGEVETRKRRKLAVGDLVELIEGPSLILVAPEGHED